MIQIIDSKKVEMTPDEHQLYQKIVASYTSLNNNGESLFIDLFETNADGIIIFLKPPSKRQTSFEVWMFLMSLMQQQHLRSLYAEVSDICNQMKDKMRELDGKLQKLSEKE